MSRDAMRCIYPTDIGATAGVRSGGLKREREAEKMFRDRREGRRSELLQPVYTMICGLCREGGWGGRGGEGQTE
eukprot:3515366-Rhodomonas_salina.2